MQALIVNRVGRFFSRFFAAAEQALFWQPFKNKFSPCATESSLSLIF